MKSASVDGQRRDYCCGFAFGERPGGMYSIFSFAFVVRIVVDDICQFYRWCSQILNMRANPPVHASPGRCRRLPSSYNVPSVCNGYGLC